MSRFTVYAAQEGRHHSHVVEGSSFEDAAMAFAEFHRPAEGDDGGMRLRVVDQESGEQQCFVIDLDAPDADQVACG